AAREEVRKIIALVERLGTLGFEINYGKSDFTFDVRWQMTPRSGTEKETNIDDAYEAVFRHQFKNNFSALKEKAKRYCLSINGENASAEFLRRFEGHQPPVRPKSEFERKEALIFQVTDLKWIDENTVEMHGGYYEHGKSASFNLYRVVRRANRWVVVDDKLLV